MQEKLPVRKRNFYKGNEAIYLKKEGLLNHYISKDSY